MKNSFQEISRTSIFINRLEETSLSWCNSHLAARTDKGIHLYEFSKNLTCLDKKLDFMETFIKSPTTSPCSKLLTSHRINSQLKNRDMYEMVLDTALWPHSEYLATEMSTVVAFEWSPRGLLQNNECILAIVNSMGSVELFVSGRTSWETVLDLSSLVQEVSEVLPRNVKEFSSLKPVVYNLASTSICWSPLLSEGEAYLVTGQKDGTILFWLIKSNHENTVAKYCGKISANIGETVILKWIPKSDLHFILISTYLNGQIIAYECTIATDNVVMIKTYVVWVDQDRMPVQHLHYRIMENQLLIVFHKHRHLIMQLLDENFKVISQYINNISDFRITSVTEGEMFFYVTTVNFKFCKIDYEIENNVLKVNIQPIELKGISETSELYSVCFSDNNVICAISTTDRKVQHRKMRLKVDIIFLQVLPDNTELEILLNNPTKQITNYWDCIELIRFKIVKTKSLPEKDYNVLLSNGDTDLYMLKIYLIILTIYNSMQISAKIEKNLLPQVSIQIIKDKIAAAYAKTNIHKLSNVMHSNNQLNDLEKECLIGSKNYLQLYSQKNKIPVEESLTNCLSDVCTIEKKYYCQNCDEEIKDFSCANGHLNMFCMLTFTLIESIDYLTCKKCNTIARIELRNTKPLCIFCDSFIGDSHLPT